MPAVCMPFNSQIKAFQTVEAKKHLPKTESRFTKSNLFLLTVTKTHIFNESISGKLTFVQYSLAG